MFTHILQFTAGERRYPCDPLLQQSAPYDPVSFFGHVRLFDFRRLTALVVFPFMLHFS